MEQKHREIIMGIISCILLLIYCLMLGGIVLSVYNWDPQNGQYISSVNKIWVVNIIGGLVSGVVIGNLALANPGETPLTQVQTFIGDSGEGKKFMQVIVWIYIGVWLIIGGSSFYVGVVKCPDVYEPLNEIGKSWLGIIVGALYAWFGIRNP
jgi:hypothetical protein